MNETKTVQDILNLMKENTQITGRFSSINSTTCLDDTNWEKLTFKNCIFFKMSFISSTWKNCIFENCIFIDCDMTGAFFSECEINIKLINCTDGFTIENSKTKNITITRYSDDMILRLLESDISQ